ncbi:hypothetical protein DPEC_G00033720 [Dallia pectoralis]|uniref:Uncharacterized protein n=1 Tax=Dallia pectoralis TaxID=75939 RepID=A0ACC2HD17_DALPE|nr:hypothetical protein DPEC_G00033720 [Dallia pectoralis]
MAGGQWGLSHQDSGCVDPADSSGLGEVANAPANLPRSRSVRTVPHQISVNTIEMDLEKEHSNLSKTSVSFLSWVVIIWGKTQSTLHSSSTYIQMRPKTDSALLLFLISSVFLSSCLPSSCVCSACSEERHLDERLL